MVNGNLIEIARGAVDDAIMAGASECDVNVSQSERFSAEARDKTITKLEQSTAKSLTLRVFVSARKATLTTSDFERDGLRTAIERVVEAARHVAKDEHNGLPDELGLGAQAESLRLFWSDVAERAPEAKLDDVINMERIVRAADSRIQNSNGAHYSDVITTHALANSRGFSGEYRSTRASRSVSPVAFDGAAKRTSSYGTASRRLASLEPVDAVARTAVRRTVELFGARKPSTMRVPVIFERDVAGMVMHDVFAALSGTNVVTSNSWASERLGERIGSELANIVDDGTIPGALGTSPFDGEGVPTRLTTVFERGVLRSFLLDTYYAKRLGMHTTGNASSAGIGPNNFVLAPGTQSLEQLIAATHRGVLVLDTIGFATEYATGTYSRGARGFAIENGELAYPIDEFTIASTYPEMLAGLDAVANDLRFDASVVSPSFRVAEMTISGN
ncbi:MAG: TldD/PmbA family protein [Candidatus Eremiobacteraeota bacterium]|nr:TldD/PmbA family protein [Candidatus Eremiobacteraeota bacterium]